jgi:hypothetical protein
MRKFILPLVLLLLFSAGCLTHYEQNPPTATEPSPPPQSTYYTNVTTRQSENMVPVTMPNVTNAAGVVYSSTSPKDARNIEIGLMNTNWVSPGKVTIDNMYKGAEADYMLRIHNGTDIDTIFDVNPRQPDGIRDDKLPLDCMDWIQLPQYSVYIPAKQTFEIPVVVKMLKDTNMKGKTYEVWISVIDKGQKGMVQTELCSRWIISTRK